MQQAQKGATRIWVAQKGAQHETTFGRGCAWHADPSSITTGPTADCTQAAQLIEGLDAKYLLGDRGYDSDAIVNQAQSQGMTTVIPPRKNRKESRSYDEDIYKLRHRVENAFLHLKRWRGIATRYAKNTSSFLAAVHIRCIALWANIS